MRSFTAVWRAPSSTPTQFARRRGRSQQEPPRTIRLVGYAISGDLPIVLLQIGDLANIDLLRQLVQAHATALEGPLRGPVIWNEDRAGYRQLLQDQIMGLIAAASKPM